MHRFAESGLSAVKLGEQIHERFLKSALRDELKCAGLQVEQVHVPPFGASNGDGRIKNLLQQ